MMTGQPDTEIFGKTQNNMLDINLIYLISYIPPIVRVAKYLVSVKF